jgi:UMP-CMP kinase
MITKTVMVLGKQGRVDDNIETIRKRFKVFVESSIPVVDYYETSGKVKKIDATKSVEEVFDSIQPLFDCFNHVSSNGYEEELSEAIKQHNINWSAVAITN